VPEGEKVRKLTDRLVVVHISAVGQKAPIHKKERFYEKKTESTLGRGALPALFGGGLKEGRGGGEPERHATRGTRKHGKTAIRKKKGGDGDLLSGHKSGHSKRKGTKRSASLERGQCSHRVLGEKAKGYDKSPADRS